MANSATEQMKSSNHNTLVPLTDGTVSGNDKGTAIILANFGKSLKIAMNDTIAKGKLRIERVAPIV